MTVTIERLERALAIAAYVVVLDGPIAAPLFSRLERELATARAAGDTVARARAMIEGYKQSMLIRLPHTNAEGH